MPGVRPDQLEMFDVGVIEKLFGGDEPGRITHAPSIRSARWRGQEPNTALYYGDRAGWLRCQARGVGIAPFGR